MILEHSAEPGKKYALALTVLVHAALVAVLFFGVQWKRKPPEVYEVELWSARPVPPVQAPPPEPVAKPEPRVEPKPEPKPLPKVEPPPPKAPDIAVKQEKKPEPKKPEPPKPEPPKPEPKKPEPRPEPKPEPKKPEAKPQPKFDFDQELAKESAQLKSAAKASAANAQHLANAAAAEAEQRASANKRGLESYAAKIRGKVRGNIVLPPNIQGNPEAIFEVSQLPSGEVLSVKLKRSSGNAGLDTAIERAILKSSPLPKPDDPSQFQRMLEIKYKPFEE